MIKSFRFSTIAVTVMGISACFSSMASEPKKDLSQTIAFLDRQARLHWFVKNGDIKQTGSQLAKLATKLNKSLTFAPYPLEDVKAAGIGGNEKTGFIYYDNQAGAGHAEALSIQRNPITKICYLQNNDIVVRDWNHDLDVVEFPCEKPDQNGLYWYPDYDFINGAYNPGLDAFYAAQASNRMYQNAFHVPTWKKEGVKAKITLLIHANTTYFNEGGFFSDGSQPWYVSLSDGDANTYPWTTLDVVSHFMSVGTALSYWGYSWGVGNGPSIATSYSDIFSKAVEYDVTGNNNWTIGGDVRKGYGALRYMDNPTKDCGFDKKPGDSCSIDNYDDYKKHQYIEPEYGAGLLNKVFYLIATSPGWDTKKAFKLFNHATSYWIDPDWNPDSGEPPKDHLNFHDVFCSLIASAHDFNYEQTNIDVVINALKQVDMDTNTCGDEVIVPRKKM